MTKYLIAGIATILLVGCNSESKCLRKCTEVVKFSQDDTPCLCRGDDVEIIVTRNSYYLFNNFCK